jgi:lysophospholipase L1-like esterase
MSQRVLAVGMGIGIALVPAFFGARWLLRELPVLAFHEPNEAERVEASSKAAERLAEGGFRVPLSEEVVANIMPLKGWRVYDPHCYFRYKGGLKSELTWKEHPNGGYDLVTNSLGLRMDAEIAPEAPDLRILLAGDSHMTGKCGNAESLHEVLAERLRAGDPARSVEAINGSQGAYSFYHYLGVLERMLHLGVVPDLFVVVVYGGNDFLAVHLWHFFNGTKRRRGSTKMKKLCAEEHPESLGQVLNVADDFRAGGPAEVELAHRMATTVMGEVQRQCAQQGIDLLVVYLPSPSELPGQADQTAIEAGRELMGLEQEDVDLLGKMGDRLLRDLEAMGIATFDLRPGFRRQDRELYWRADLHLNVDGHARAAELLEPWVEDWWTRR